MSKRKPQNSHFPRSSSFRNLSSNEVRYKFREREKVEITFPTKHDAKLIFDRDLVEVERNVQRFARSCPISRRSPRRRRASQPLNYSISVPCKASALLLKILWFFLLRKNAPAASGSRNCQLSIVNCQSSIALLPHVAACAEVFRRRVEDTGVETVGGGQNVERT